MTLISLDHLRLLVSVADSGNFTKSATRLGVTQPTVSRAISELEQAWDGRLFDRTGRGVVLSDLGHEALPRARELLRAAEQLSDDLRSFDAAPRGDVTVGIPPTRISALVPDLFRGLRADRPGIRLRIFEGFSEQIVRWLAEGVIDIGIHSRYFEVQDSGDADEGSRIVLVAAAALGRLPEHIEFADLARYPLVLPAVTNSLRSLFDNVARREGQTLNVVVEADSVAAQRELVLTGGCSMVAEYRPAWLDDPPGRFTAALISRPGIKRRTVIETGRKPLSRAARDVLARVTAIAGVSAERQP